MTRDDNPPATLDQLIALETSVWQALSTGDKSADLAALATDFLGVYPSGFSDRADHAGQLDSGPSVAGFEILQPRAQIYTSDLAMLSYLARYRRIGHDGWAAMYVSSLWRRDGQVWRNVFSQDTPAAD